MSDTDPVKIHRGLQGIHFERSGVSSIAMGRVPGWTVQCQDQQANNILIRPLTLYDGPQPRDYVPLEER